MHVFVCKKWFFRWLLMLLLLRIQIPLANKTIWLFERKKAVKNEKATERAEWMREKNHHNCDLYSNMASLAIPIYIYDMMIWCVISHSFWHHKAINQIRSTNRSAKRHEDSSEIFLLNKKCAARMRQFLMNRIYLRNVFSALITQPIW